MIIAIIPAKGKSKRLPNKNMNLILGKPMLYYTIKYATSSKIIDDVFVSTEDNDIIKFCQKMQIKTIKRSETLCGETLILDVYKDAYKKLNYLNIDIIVGLQPDHPDRNLNIDNVLSIFKKGKLDYLTSLESNGTKNGAYFILAKNVMEGAEPSCKDTIVDDCTNVHLKEDLIKAEHRIEKLNLIYEK